MACVVIWFCMADPAFSLKSACTPFALNPEFEANFAAARWTLAHIVLGANGNLGPQAGHFLGDLVVDVALGKFSGYAQRILDCVHVRRSVGYKTDTAHAEQRRSTVLGVV